MVNELFLRGQANNLETAFFLQQDKILLDKLRELHTLKKNKEDLKRVSGIHDEAILDRFIELGISPPIIAALAAIPLIEVAWADGKVDEKERHAVLDGVKSIGIPEGGIEYQLLENWLSHRPEPKLLQAWLHYISGLCNSLNGIERKTLREELVGQARKVAEASGGFLGMGNKISPEEAEMLSKLEKAFGA